MEGESGKFWVVLQIAGALIVGLIIQRFLSRQAAKHRVKLEARKRFIEGAQLLSKAKAESESKSREEAQEIGKEALEAASEALRLNPSDAASYILKGLCYEFLGGASNIKECLKCLDLALSPPVVETLSESEVSDALLKRSQFHSDPEKDLRESVKKNPKNCKALCVLGSYLEKKNLVDEARELYDRALEVDPGYLYAESALGRISSRS
eukprot:TRINITY_DN2349_c0_g1_i1.p1 TRINITY_DN2349_c0_g1~~TRINITY_DN2349_c0_g1_i1.p1  ORF type:complete len:209 (-),score=18.08 TRINITY_DN2349_c0_g1_i1:288-914(-)